jgi:hypothetical protein
MPPGPVATERIKLIAAFLNALGVALVSLGVFAPLIYQATSLETVPVEKHRLLYGVIVICMVGAATLHFLGQAMLGFLDGPKLSENDDDRQ